MFGPTSPRDRFARLVATWLCAAILIVSAVSCGGRPTGPSVIDADAPTEFTTTESGLKYRILRRSDGKKPTPSDRVTVDYVGWLDNGREFDASYDGMAPVTFSLSGVVAGWTEGLQYIGEGGMIELEIPPELGYGAQGTGSIPPNSTLHFKVELHKVK